MCKTVAKPKFPDNPSMSTQLYPNWWTRIATFLVAALTSASIAWWGLTLNTPRAGLPSVDLRPAPQIDASALGRALGAGTMPATQDTTPTPVAITIQLLGVVASEAGQGHALMAVGTAPAKTYKVGSAVSDGLVLQSVSARSANLGPTMAGPASQTLELPPIPKL